MICNNRYMSPERISHAPYGPTSDIWALGLVLLEVSSRFCVSYGVATNSTA